MIEAARQLGGLIASRPLPATVNLDRIGLKAALDFNQFNREQIAEVAVYYLARAEPLRSVLEQGRSQGFLSVARQLCLKTSSEILRDDLLQKALSENIIRMPDLEQLLTALRHVFLIELPADRYQDRSLMAFVITLSRQCWFNEYVWATSEEEDAFIRENSLDLPKALAGGAVEGVRLLLTGLYRPISELVGPKISPADLRGLRPNAVREAIIQQLSESADLTAQASRIERASPIQNETSLKVAVQYEGNPYPRWTSLGMLTDPNGWKETLKRHFGEDRIAFLSSPFDVLIAGCGTGLQAVAASFAYGPQARITAVDLSASSLAYAQRMAAMFGATNITFLQGDILELQRIDEFARRFQVIECTGVLHHMADPLEGWRALKACLAPNGVMLIALYSEIARSRWTALKSDTEFPGEYCDDAALRRFRQTLFTRCDADLGPEFKGLRDLYTTSGFRDLILHVSERRFTLNEIENFLKDEKLRFRGFFKEQDFAEFKRQFPSEPWPGPLSKWAEFEAANPNHFAGMYYFWCDLA